MNNWTIGKRITFGFATVTLIALILGGLAYSRLLVISRHSHQIVQQSLPTIELVYQVEKIANDNIQVVYKHINSRDPEDQARLETVLGASAAANTQLYDQLNQLITDSDGRALLDKVKTARAENTRVRTLVLGLSRQGTNSLQAYHAARSQFDPATAQYLAALDALIDYAKMNTDTASKNIQAAVFSSQVGILTCLSLSLVVGTAVAWIIILGTSRILRQVSSSLNDGASQVASAAGQVSCSSQSLAEGASEQAASIEETGASLEELSSMTKRNAENSQKANELSKQTRSAADKGVADMREMNTAMAAIKDSSDDIAKIIRTIDEIAFQTNILALNAAVEAARAGEAGMGFAVVADEVRNLAQRSAQAAKETASKIEGAIIKTALGVELSGKVSQALNDIVAKARLVDELAAEVAGASREQTQGITQISTAVGQMDKVTQNNAANAEESAAAAEELNAQAESMKQSVANLLRLVGGNDQTRPVLMTFPKPHAKYPGSAAPVGKPANGTNGKNHRETASVRRPSEFPSDGDFKDF
jgi:methyl-accepting chemotaxis protein